MAKNSFDIIIIGGGPAGMTAAIFSRMMYPAKSIAVIKNIDEGVVPCGTPYMFHTMKNPRDNVLACGRAGDLQIEVLHGDVTAIVRSEKKLETSIGDLLYDKLILSTGSNPIVPPIEGVKKAGVFAIKKDYAYLSKLNTAIMKAKRIAIIGGGFIGIEFADELSSIKGKQITVIEMLPEVLGTFDSEFSKEATTELLSKKVSLLTEKKVDEIVGEKKATGVKLSDGTIIKADLVLLGIGAFPNTKLAADAGLKLSKRKAIVVNKYMRTSDTHIFAAGDCAMKKDFFTGKESPIMLASNAATEAKILASNLFVPLPFKSGASDNTIAVYSTKVGDKYFGSAGLTEKQAKQRNLSYFVGVADNCFDKHPETMPGTHPVHLKLLFARRTKRLIGAQVSGGLSVGEMTNMLGLAIQNNLKLKNLRSMQVGSHPHLTSNPTMYPVVLAAYDAWGSLMGMKKPESK